MKILHICAGWQKWNGAANIARMIMDEQRREGYEVSFATWAKVRELRAADEVWIHCGWLPCLWWAAIWGRNVHWMPEACYDPVRLKFHGWKKLLVGPVERWCLRRCDRIVATCEAEKEWIESYLGRRCPPIELTDIKRFFKLHGEVSTQSRRVAEYAESDVRLPSADGGLGQRPRDNSASSRLCVNNKNQDEPLHLLYLGRRHPLKGVEYLETAVKQIQESSAYSPLLGHPLRGQASPGGYASLRLCVKIISSAFGEELEKVWDWCDVLVLPTLSDNFGLVIAEALERGKCVITTDGAPAWGENLSRVERVEGLTQRRRDAECAEMFSRVEHVERVEGGLWSGYEGRLIYLKGYRDGSNEQRVELLKNAIEMLKHEGNMV